MRSQVLTTAAVLLTMSSAAFAQTATTTAAPAPAATNTTASGKTDSTSMRQQIMSNLQASGFSDVKVMPDSFLVQAKDKSGNPMTMFIGPNSVTEVSSMNTSNSSGTAMPATGSGMFTSVPRTDDLTSKVVGLDVYNKANQDIGTIKDLAFDGNGVKAYIVGVGGFLGMGEHYVAVRPSAINVTYNTGEKKWHAAIDTNADQLKAAPEYKYSTNS